MSRVEVVSSGEEETIWQHTSQTKRRKLSKSSHSSTSTRINEKVNKKKKDHTKISLNKFSSQGFISLPTTKTSSFIVKDEDPGPITDFKPTKIYSQIIQKASIIKCRQSSSTQVKDDPDILEIPDKQKRKSKSKTTNRKFVKKKAAPATPDDKKWSGRCRNCQFPFSALNRIETPSWHMEDCLDAPYSSTDQCPSGIHCNSTIASHYKKYRHTALSRSEHKKENAKPPSSTGDVVSAKVKLEFTDKHSVQPRLSIAVNDVINLDSDSPATTNSDTGLSLSQNEKMTIVKERTDKLKRKSVLTLMKQTAHKLKRPPSLQNVVDDDGTECLSDKTTSKSNLRDNTCNGDKLTSAPFVDRFKGTIKEETNVLHNTTSYAEDKDIKVYKQRELESEEIITKVNPIDLIDSESSNSIQDINCISDNSRSIQEMLKDVFDDSQNNRENSDENNDSDIIEDSQQIESDSDSDIIHTCHPTISTLKNKVILNKDKIGNDLNKNSLIRSKDINVENNITDLADAMKSFGESSNGANVNCSNYSFPQHYDESSSCSRDSVKGFFARKLEENMLKNPQKNKVETELSKNDIGDDCGTKEDIDSKTNCQENNKKRKDFEKTNTDVECMTTKYKFPLKDNIGQQASKQYSEKSFTSVQRKTKKSGKTLKSRFVNQPTQTKNAIKKEIKLMQLDGLGKITVETCSSEEDSFETSDKTVKTNTVNHTDLAMSVETCKGNDIDRNSQKKSCNNSLTESTGFNHAREHSGNDSRDRKGHRVLPFIQESAKDLNLTPKFQINDVRSTRDDIDLPGGFFIDINAEIEDNDDCRVNVNLSEVEEEDNDIANNKYDDLVNDHNYDNDFLETKDKNSDVKSMQELLNSDNQTVPTFNDLNLPSLGSDSEDTDKVLDNIACKVQEIQKNALDILMQTSKALHRRNNSKKQNRMDTSTSQLNTSRNVNEILMSNRGKTVQTVTKPVVKSKQNNQAAQNNQKSEPETSTNNQRKCPFYKKIPGTSFTVDAFRYGSIPDCKIYFLSHFHYDHYGGLTKKFTHPIYCSKITGNLIIKKIGVQANYIHTVPLNTPTIVEDVEIELLEANHCPGAVLILFKLRSGQIFLHTGDFRACRDMELYPPLQNLRIHFLYLDTTYCDPQYDFPPQKDVVNYAIKLAKDAVLSNPGTLIVCGSYTIGKERIFRGIAEELDCKISVTRDKKSVLDCLEDGWLQARVTLKWEESRLHVLPMAKLNYVGLKEHLQKNGSKYTAVLGIKPTGWTYNKKLIGLDHIKPEFNKDSIKVYGLPYSEHSSFLELKQFVQFTKPDKILPTVNNGNYHSRKKMEAIFSAWMEEIRQKPANAVIQPSVSKWAK